MYHIDWCCIRYDQLESWCMVGWSECIYCVHFCINFHQQVSGIKLCFFYFAETLMYSFLLLFIIEVLLERDVLFLSSVLLCSLLVLFLMESGPVWPNRWTLAMIKRKENFMDLLLIKYLHFHVQVEIVRHVYVWIVSVRLGECRQLRGNSHHHASSAANLSYLLIASTCHNVYLFNLYMHEYLLQ